MTLNGPWSIFVELSLILESDTRLAVLLLGPGSKLDLSLGKKV